MPLRPRIVIIILLCTLCCAVRAWTASPTNFQIQDSLLKLAAQQVRTQLAAVRSPALRLRCSDHPARWLVEQQLRSALGEASLVTSDSSSGFLDVGIADVAVRYASVPDRDSLLRTIHVELRCAAAGRQLSDISLQRSDLVARSDQSLLENPGYAFCSAPLPAVQRSTWDDILEPVVVLAALATTVIVLFSVRSQ